MRRFVVAAAFLFVLPILISLTACAPVGDAADLVLLNGTVYTLDESQPWAEAVAVKGDRLMAVGTNAEVEALVGADTRTIDLAGAFVLPGFNDAHVHIDGTGSLLVGVNLLDVHEGDLFAERIRGATERLPAGSWITGGSWGAYEQWAMGSAGEEGGTDEVREPFTPHRDLIDEFTAEHPVLVTKYDRSEHLANGLALEMAGIDENTPNPSGGEILKDENGRPTGVLKGSAATLVRRVMSEKTFERRMIEFAAVLDEARQGGVTTIQDLTGAEMMRVYQETQARGELTARIMARPQLWYAEDVEALGLTTGFGDDWIKIVGYKAWVDGIMGSSGAMFFQPYDHDPENSGLIRDIMLPEGEEDAWEKMTIRDKYTDFPPGNLEKLLHVAVETGIPPHVHSIGDKGNRILLDIYEKVLNEHDMVGTDHRWRIIHAQVVHPDDFRRFGELGIVAEVNPYHISDDMRWMEERIGKERSLGAYAFRTLKDNGAVLLFGSDAPGTNAARYYLNPKYGLYAAVSRQTLDGEPAEGWYPDERLTIEEAIAAATKDPAWACFEEDIKGTLTPGKLADIAVIDTNLVEAGNENPSALLDSQVLYTIAGGKIVYEGGQ